MAKFDMSKLYGKVRVVDSMEDYKVRIVEIAEDLRVRKVTMWASSPGQWEMVTFNEDFKVRFVDFGEDFKIRFVEFGEGVSSSIKLTGQK